jgi:hypothetical protein
VDQSPGEKGMEKVRFLRILLKKEMKRQTEIFLEYSPCAANR